MYTLIIAIALVVGIAIGWVLQEFRALGLVVKAEQEHVLSLHRIGNAIIEKNTNGESITATDVVVPELRKVGRDKTS